MCSGGIRVRGDICHPRSADSGAEGRPLRVAEAGGCLNRMARRGEGADRPWEFHALRPETWPDFERLFGKRGAAGGCWCMWWRLTRSQFDAAKGEGNRRAMKAIVDSGRIPGILAFRSEEAVGWCSVAPREEFPRLERSRILKPVDNQEVWSVVCFFVEKPHRRSGVSLRLLRAAKTYARSSGAKILEGYPVEPKRGTTPAVFAYQRPAA